MEEVAVEVEVGVVEAGSVLGRVGMALLTSSPLLEV